MLSGKKTYIVAGLSLVYAAIGWYLGHLSTDQAIQIAQTGVIGATLRDGIKKIF